LLEEKEISIEIKRPEFWVLLAFLGLVLVLDLQVAMNTPINFGDEGYHTRMAQYIAENVEYPVWTPFEKLGTWENGRSESLGFARPPLWNILEASFLYLFGFNEVIIRFLTPFIVFLTGISVFILAKRIFNEKVAFIAAVISVTVPSMATYSVLFYTDVLATFYMAMFFLLFILALKENRKKYWLLSGVFGALALLTKIPALAVYAFVAIAFFYQLLKERKFLELFNKYLPLVVIMVVVISGWLVRNYYYYKNPVCYPIPFVKIFSMKGCALNLFQDKYKFQGQTEQTGTEQNVFRVGLMSYFSFAYGNLWLVTLTFFCGLVILLIKRDLTSYMLLISLALLLFIFYLSTGRAEDTARYTLGWVPIVALICAVWLDEAYEFIKKYQKYVALVIFIFVLVLSYMNLNEKLTVMNQVKQFSPLFFEACDWIEKNTPKDSLLMTVWAHRAVYNCQRNAAPNLPDISLSKDLNYTLAYAKQHGVTHLFIQKFSLSTQPLEERYTVEFVQFLENNPDNFKKIFENGPSLQECLQQGGCDGNIVYEIKF